MAHADRTAVQATALRRHPCDRSGQCRTLWDRPSGTARANGPFGIPSELPVHVGAPNNGGAALTASGLIFIASATDNLIRAMDIDTGETR